MNIKTTLYHATNADYENFDLNYTTSEIGIHLGTLEQANNVADKFIKSDKKEKIFILKVECDFKNPLRLEDFGNWESFQMILQINQRTNLKLKTNLTDKQVRKALIKIGYDSIVYENDFEGEGDSYISLIPQKQTKIVLKKEIHKQISASEFINQKKSATSSFFKPKTNI